MTQERIAKLNATEGWTWEEEDSFEINLENWIYQYQKLGKYPSGTSKDPYEKRAGRWQGYMRKHYKNKEKRMTQEYINILNTTERWKWEEEDTFDSNLENWIQQYQKLGKYPSYKSTNPEEKRAGKWQSDMRTYYKKKEKRMTQERIDKLNATEVWKWEG